MNHQIFHWLGKISWAVTALVSINAGLEPFGRDFFSSNFYMNNLMSLQAPIFWVILLSGLYSLVLLVMMCTGMGGCCGKGKCK